MQSGNYQCSTANAQAIYAFYRIAAEDAAEYDSRH
jgi:hypothetical protein